MIYWSDFKDEKMVLNIKVLRKYETSAIFNFKCLSYFLIFTFIDRKTFFKACAWVDS